MSANFLTLLSWLFDATAKGSVVIILVAIAQLTIGRRLSARWRHALWLLVVLRLVIPSAPSTSWSIFNLLPVRPGVPTHMRVASAPDVLAPAIPDDGTIATIVTARREPSSMWRWIIGIWLLGFIVLAARIAVATLRIHLALRNAPDSALKCASTLDEARRLLGITRHVRLVETSVVRTPALHGLFHPALLVPRGLLDSFEPEEFRHIVLHELWHLRRLDVAVSWLLAAVSALHWFNPFVWFAVSRIQEERELACDELALSCLEREERFGYGRTILKLLDRFRAPAPIPALVGIVNHKQKMKRRLTMIASFQTRSRLSILFVATVLGIAALGLTDARGGERQRVMTRTLLDPAAEQSATRLSERVSFDLSNASISDVLNTVSNKTGLTVAQSADAATSAVQQAKFTIHADNVPAHAVLAEALMPFKLAPVPDANGVTIASAKSCDMMTREHGDEGADDGNITKRIVVNEETRVSTSAGEEKHVRIRTDGPMECRLNADGSMHREMTLKINENGVVSEGKLVIDVTGASKQTK